MAASTKFPITRKYISLRLGFEEPYAPLRNRPIIIETDKRIKREESYSFIRVFWWFRFLDEYPVISVPHGAKSLISKWLSGKQNLKRLPTDQEADELMEIFNRHHEQNRELQAIRKYRHKTFLCNRDTINKIPTVERRASLVRIDRLGLRYEESISSPDHCILDGLAYGISVDEKIVSVAIAHRTGLMEDTIADVGIETAVPYRRRGYARAAVYAVADHCISKNGEAWYECSPRNMASQATALSVGFLPLAESLGLRTANVGDTG